MNVDNMAGLAPVLPNQQEDKPKTTLTEEDVAKFFSDGSDTSSPLEQQAEQQPTEEKPEEDEGDFKQKYLTLKGKFDKEVPRLYKELNSLKKEKSMLLNRVSFLEQVVSDYLKAKEQAASATQQSQAEEEDPDVRKLKEDYPEVYSAVEKLLRSRIYPEINKLRVDSAQTSFYSSLDALVPEWRQLNSDPDFLDWLKQPSDEIPTMSRHQLMLMSFSQGDANAVAGFFRKYLSVLAGKQQSQKQQRTPGATASDPPHRSSTASVPSQGGKEYFTESDIKDFYTKVALGRIPEPYKTEMEKKILAAIADNRILYGK